MHQKVWSPTEAEVSYTQKAQDFHANLLDVLKESWKMINRSSLKLLNCSCVVFYN